MKQIRTVTFDAGGTLLYPWPSVGEIYAERMTAHGMRVDASRIEAGFARAMGLLAATSRAGSAVSDREWWREVVRLTIADMDQPDSFDDLFDDLWHTFADPHRWRLYPGTRETLAVLADRGYRLVILSNWDDRLRVLLDGLDLTPLFQALVISAEVGIEKPDPRIFQYTREMLTQSPHELLHVGDSIRHDVAGAEGDGWRWRLIVHQDDGADLPDGHIGRLHDLLAILPGCRPEPSAWQ